MGPSNFLVKYKAYLVAGSLAALQVAHAFGLVPEPAYSILLNLLAGGGAAAVTHKGVTLYRAGRAA